MATIGPISVTVPPLENVTLTFEVGPYDDTDAETPLDVTFRSQSEITSFLSAAGKSRFKDIEAVFSALPDEMIGCTININVLSGKQLPWEARPDTSVGWALKGKTLDNTVITVAGPGPDNWTVVAGPFAVGNVSDVDYSSVTTETEGPWFAPSGYAPTVGQIEEQEFAGFLYCAAAMAGVSSGLMLIQKHDATKFFIQETMGTSIFDIRDESFNIVRPSAILENSTPSSGLAEGAIEVENTCLNGGEVRFENFTTSFLYDSYFDFGLYGGGGFRVKEGKLVVHTICNSIPVARAHPMAHPTIWYPDAELYFAQEAGELAVGWIGTQGQEGNTDTRDQLGIGATGGDGLLVRGWSHPMLNPDSNEAGRLTFIVSNVSKVYFANFNSNISPNYSTFAFSDVEELYLGYQSSGPRAGFWINWDGQGGPESILSMSNVGACYGGSFGPSFISGGTTHPLLNSLPSSTFISLGYIRIEIQQGQTSGSSLLSCLLLTNGTRFYCDQEFDIEIPSGPLDGITVGPGTKAIPIRVEKQSEFYCWENGSQPNINSPWGWGNSFWGTVDSTPFSLDLKLSERGTDWGDIIGQPANYIRISGDYYDEPDELWRFTDSSDDQEEPFLMKLVAINIVSGAIYADKIGAYIPGYGFEFYGSFLPTVYGGNISFRWRGPTSTTTVSAQPDNLLNYPASVGDQVVVTDDQGDSVTLEVVHPGVIPTLGGNIAPDRMYLGPRRWIRGGNGSIVYFLWA